MLPAGLEIPGRFMVPEALLTEQGRVRPEFFALPPRLTLPPAFVNAENTVRPEVFVYPAGFIPPAGARLPRDFFGPERMPGREAPERVERVQAVRGTVTVAGAPFAGARVRLEPGEVLATTGPDGRYFAAVAEPGTFSVHLSLDTQRHDLVTLVAPSGIAPPGAPRQFVELRRDAVVVAENDTVAIDFALFPERSQQLLDQPLQELEVQPRSATLTGGEEQTFSAAHGTGTYRWHATLGSFSSTSDAATTYTAPASAGTHFVIVSDTAGNVAMARVEVTNPLTITPRRSTVALGETQELTVLGGLGPYVWSASAGSFSAPEGFQVTYLPPAVAGEYEVVVTDAAGKSATAAISVVLSLALTPASATLQIGESVTFTASGGTGEYRWRTSAGEVEPLTGEQTTYTAPQLVSTQSLIVTDSAGSSAVAVIAVSSGTLRVTPALANLGFQASQAFSATGGVPPYAWTVASGGLSATESAEGEEVTYTAPSVAGVYEINVTDRAGNAGLASVNVNRALRISPAAAVVERGGTSSFTALGGSGTYTWSTTGGELSALSGSPVTYTAPDLSGKENIILADTAGSVVTAVVEVIEAPLPSPDRLILGPQESSRLSVAGGRAPYTWHAESGDLSATSGDSIIHTGPVLSGSYFVTVIDSEGVASQVPVNIVSGASLVVTPNQERYAAGELLEIIVTTLGRGVADLYVRVELPAGTPVSITELNEFSVPDVSLPFGSPVLLVPVAQETTIISVPLPETLVGALAGEYRVTASLVVPGSDSAQARNILASDSAVFEVGQ
ncbi:MAG: hypothetical protein HYY96_10875 [Candidatus Tectomicrobia bacterium]|nr:hypothetical protein [Candidatus Tectomicrobia bacterium]